MISPQPSDAFDLEEDEIIMTLVVTARDGEFPCSWLVVTNRRLFATTLTEAVEIPFIAHRAHAPLQ